MGVNNFANLAARTAHYIITGEGHTGGREVNDFLRLKPSDYVMLINLVPIEVGGESVSPAPSAESEFKIRFTTPAIASLP